MKKLLFLFFCFFFVNYSYAQPDAKGVTVVNTDRNTITGKTWAIIIGISEYQNIDDLRYAHKDAEAFYKYLRTPQVNVPTENIKLLLNKDATSAEIYGALDWLTESVKENDRVIFYFSGHGDVEKKTIYQIGFLLAHDSPTSAYMTKGTVGLAYLQSYLDSYIVKNKAKDVLLIVDACKSGKLAGGIQGVQATMKALNEQWNGQITKILSAQEGELSLEDAKWGGGRGVFSYYLMKGIQGLANRNTNDNTITTMELGNYLPIMVSEETTSSQNPKIEGEAKRVLFTFDEVLLADAKKDDRNLNGQMMAAVTPKKEIGGKGFDIELDSTTKKSYNKYLDFVNKGWLLWGNKITDTVNCALYIYNKLLDDPAAINIRPSLKSSFLTALQKGAQSKLDSLIKGIAPKDYGYRYYQEIMYASKIVDKDHILHNYIKARALYFNAFNTDSDAKTFKMLKQALALEGDAAYIYFGLASTFRQKNVLDSAIYYNQKAIELAPTWSYPINEMGIIYEKQKNYEKANPFYIKAFEMNKLEWRHSFNVGKIYLRSKDFEKAKDMFIISIKTDSTIANTHHGLAIAYNKLEQFNKALYHYKRSTELDLETPFWFNDLAEFYETRGDTLNAIKSYQQALNIDSTSVYAYSSLAYLNFKSNKIETAIAYYKKALNYQKNNQDLLYRIGLLYQVIDKPFEGYAYLFKSLAINYDSLAYSKVINGIKKYPSSVLGGFQFYLKNMDTEPGNSIFNYLVGKTYYHNNDLLNTLLYFEKCIAEAKPNTFNNTSYYDFAAAYSAKGDVVKGIKYFKLALETGYVDYDLIVKDKSLDNLKKTSAFADLMKSYFPDKKWQ